MRKETGFTLIEAMIVIAIIGAMAAIAVPSTLSRLPDVRLKAAARDLHDNLQRAKMMAAKTNTPHAIFFDNTGDPLTMNYQILTDPGLDGNWGTADDICNNPGPDGVHDSACNEIPPVNDDIPEPVPVTLANYKSGVVYGSGNATKDATQTGGPLPAGDVSFNNNIVVFNPMGMLSGVGGYVYFSNNINSSFAVGVPVITGNVQLKKWYSASNLWD